MGYHRKKRISAVILAAVLLLSSGCANSGGNGVNPAQGNKWLDSDLIGSVTEDTNVRLQDDFAAAANKDWILNSGIKGRNFSNIGNIVADKKMAVLKERSAEGKEAEELFKYADLAMDWEKRNEDGVEPIRPYIESIRAISSIEEFYAWMTDMEKNPLMLSLVEVSGIQGIHFITEPEEYYVAFSQPSSLSLGDTSEYTAFSDLEYKMMLDKKVTYVLDRLGYDKGEISDILKLGLAFEKEIVNRGDTTADYLNHEKDYIHPYEEVMEKAGSYPLEEYMKEKGFSNIRHLVGDYSYLSDVEKLCAPNHLEGIKSMMILRYVDILGRYLDRDTYDAFEEAEEPRSKPDLKESEPTEEQTENEIILDAIASSGVMAAMDKIYLEKYVDDATVDELTQMTKDIIAAYKNEIFPKQDWLSEEGKAAATEKLDAIVLNIVRPDASKIDYSSLDIASKEEGGTFLEAELDSMRYLNRMKAGHMGDKYDRTSWDPYNAELSTTVTNATYMPMQNSINIYAGILEDPIYYKGMSREELYSGIGAVVGHEITHGFDRKGVSYDKNGDKKDWMPDEDYNNFIDRSSGAAYYYTGIVPYASSGNYFGFNVQEEATADMGGIRVTLKLAEKYPDFDYDTYFRHYARMWAAQVDEEVEEAWFKTDSHPLNFLRINVGLQQFDEFLETYDVKEGDGMYLAPEERIAVW